MGCPTGGEREKKGGEREKGEKRGGKREGREERRGKREESESHVSHQCLTV